MTSNVRKEFEKNLETTSQQTKELGNKLDQLEQKLETTYKELEKNYKETSKNLENKMEEILRILKPE